MFVKSVPNEEDWRSDTWDVDTPYAYERFNGKTHAEAETLFHTNPVSLIEDLISMPNRVFIFYVKAYITYLLSMDSEGNSDAASCFIWLVDHMSEHQRESVLPLWCEIEPVLKKLACQQEFYDADWCIYGDFRTKIRSIAQRGFPVSFDTDLPEVVPANATVSRMAYSNSTVSLAIASQIFSNSGLSLNSNRVTRNDLVAIFGNPDDTGGGLLSEFGFIQEWVRYHRIECQLLFRFDGESVSAVVFMPPV